MKIDQNLFTVINIIACLILAYGVFTGYKQGFVYKLLSMLSLVISCFIAYLFSPVMAYNFPLINLEDTLKILNFEPILNIVVWFIILLIIVKVILSLILPLFKSISKIPFLGFFNKLLGIPLGFLNSLIIILMLTVLLKTPIVQNGQEVIENTLLKPFSNISNTIISTVIKNIDTKQLSKQFPSFNVEQTQKDLIQWMQENVINKKEK